MNDLLFNHGILLALMFALVSLSLLVLAVGWSRTALALTFLLVLALVLARAVFAAADHMELAVSSVPEFMSAVQEFASRYSLYYGLASGLAFTLLLRGTVGLPYYLRRDLPFIVAYVVLLVLAVTAATLDHRYATIVALLHQWCNSYSLWLDLILPIISVVLFILAILGGDGEPGDTVAIWGSAWALAGSLVMSLVMYPSVLHTFHTMDSQSAVLGSAVLSLLWLEVSYFVCLLTYHLITDDSLNDVEEHRLRLFSALSVILLSVQPLRWSGGLQIRQDWPILAWTAGLILCGGVICALIALCVPKMESTGRIAVLIERGKVESLTVITVMFSVVYRVVRIEQDIAWTHFQISATSICWILSALGLGAALWIWRICLRSMTWSSPSSSSYYPSRRSGCLSMLSR